MDKPFNIQVLELKTTLTRVLNSSPLPISVKSMIVNELYEAAESKAREVIASELKEYNSELEKSKKAKKEEATNDKA
jgi:predicted flavoprotein YhiN